MKILDMLSLFLKSIFITLAFLFIVCLFEKDSVTFLYPTHDG